MPRRRVYLACIIVAAFIACRSSNVDSDITKLLAKLNAATDTIYSMRSDVVQACRLQSEYAGDTCWNH